MVTRKTNAAGSKPAATPAAAPSGPVDAQLQQLPATGSIEEQLQQLPTTGSIEEQLQQLPVTGSIDELIGLRERLAERDPNTAAMVGVRVIGPASGRRRAGRAFGAEPVDIALLDLEEDKLRAIDADPLLSWAVVRLGDAEGEGEGNDLPDGGAEGSGGR